MEESSWLALVANKIGCPEAGLRLLISLLFGYPIAFFYRKFVFHRHPNLQHLYFILCGILIGFFNYGFDVKHSFIAITVTYLVLKCLGGNMFSVILVFLYTMSHLLIGYWTTATNRYDIKWTMAQCVLTLRLIGVAFNVYDGQQPKHSLGEENKKTALDQVPGILEVFAHSYFPASFLVGPQISVRRYIDFVKHKLDKKEKATERQRFGSLRTSSHRTGLHRPRLSQSVIPGLIRFATGLTYLLLYQFGTLYINDDFILSEKYKSFPMWQKFLLLGLWSRVTLYKYVSCWLITEGSCIVIGLTYNGVDGSGKIKWDGCSNVNLRVFENTIKMNQYIESFNINTNQWVAQNIYKRLKFLKVKTLSHIGTLLFLAIWHGFHSGYYATFFFEYIIITAEKSIIMLFENTRVHDFIRNRFIYPFVYVILRLYTFIVMGYAMVPFILLKKQKYLPVFKQFNFSIHIVCVIILLLTPIFKRTRLARSDTFDILPQKKERIRKKPQLKFKKKD